MTKRQHIINNLYTIDTDILMEYINVKRLGVKVSDYKEYIDDIKRNCKGANDYILSQIVGINKLVQYIRDNNLIQEEQDGGEVK